jgi:ankyrin repeat protein
MIDERFRRLIEQGDVAGVRSALEADPGLANRTIHWHLKQDNESDPLHFVSDCVANGWLTNGKEGDVATLLLVHGAQINGTHGRQSPLIGSASLGAERVSEVLIEAGAELEATSIYGSRALHWAAWMGASATVEMLLARGAQVEVKDTKFAATPLFWAVHGFGPHGPKKKTDQVGAARKLIEAGASVRTVNKHGLSAIEIANSCASKEMHELLERYA